MYINLFKTDNFPTVEKNLRCQLFNIPLFANGTALLWVLWTSISVLLLPFTCYSVLNYHSLPSEHSVLCNLPGLYKWRSPSFCRTSSHSSKISPLPKNLANVSLSLVHISLPETGAILFTLLWLNRVKQVQQCRIRKR